jgi:hypothetical protein
MIFFKFYKFRQNCKHYLRIYFACRPLELSFSDTSAQYTLTVLRSMQCGPPPLGAAQPTRNRRLRRSSQPGKRWGRRVSSPKTGLWPELGRNVHRRAPTSTQEGHVRHVLESGALRDKCVARRGLGSCIGARRGIRRARPAVGASGRGLAGLLQWQH